jgi:phosphoribosylformylglycinamidine synthase
MKNDYQIGAVRISVPPTLLFSTIGKIEDVRKVITMDVKKPGDIVYVLGKTYRELGGSEYYALHGAIGNAVPKVRPEAAKILYRRLGQAIQEGLVASCHDCSDGGLGVAVAESAFAGGLGAEIDLSRVPAEAVIRDDELMFSESQSRFIATIRPENRATFENILGDSTFAAIGVVTHDGLLKVKGLAGSVIAEQGISSLKEAWQKPLSF